jgi:hypothetical protein
LLVYGLGRGSSAGEEMVAVKSPVLALVAMTLLLAGVLGSSLGLAAAGTRPPLSAGVNPTVGGPLGESLEPGKFLSCLPASSWTALYTWDAPNQRWLHFFNTSQGIPSYVNNSAVGGIVTIPRFSGVALIMASSVSNPFFPDRSSETCP